MVSATRAPCPHCGSRDPVFAAISEAVLAVASERAVEPILKAIVESARELAGAQYAALGVPDGEGSFARFVTSGVSDAQWKAIGPLPRAHGLLGALLEDNGPVMLNDLHDHPRFRGWPGAHPDMRAFLGMPVLAGGEIIGTIFLANKLGGGAFTEADAGVIGVLAAHAAIALTNARLLERSRELTIVEERNRLARELHDAVAQTLFSVRLTAEAAAGLLERDPDGARAALDSVQRLSREAIGQLRSVIFELRPAELEADGLVATLRKHAQMLSRSDGARVSVHAGAVRALPRELEAAIFRIAQEALHNAVAHAGLCAVVVRLDMPAGRVVLEVSDDGTGFDVESARRSSRRLGLRTMAERAEAAGGVLEIRSRRGAGTTVRLEVPGA